MSRSIIGKLERLTYLLIKASRYSRLPNNRITARPINYFLVTVVVSAAADVAATADKIFETGLGRRASTTTRNPYIAGVCVAAKDNELWFGRSNAGCTKTDKRSLINPLAPKEFCKKRQWNVMYSYISEIPANGLTRLTRRKSIDILRSGFFSTAKMKY